MSAQFHAASDVIHPDKMKRKDMIKMIVSFPTDIEASNWWLRHASHKVSKAAFKKARNI